MKPKSTIILIVLLVLAVAFLVIRQKYGHKPTDAPAEDTIGTLTLLPAGGATKISFNNVQGQTIVLEKSGGKWRLTQPWQAAADESRVNQIVAALEKLSYKKKIASDQADAATSVTGLDKPQFTLTAVDAKGASHTLRVGQTLQLGSASPVTYVQPQGDTFVYQATADFSAMLPAASDLRSNDVLDLAEADVTHVSVSRGSASYTLERKEGQWRLTKPVSARVDQAKAGSIISALAHLQAQSWVAQRPTGYQAYGLDKPSARIAITVRAADKAGAKTAPRTFTLVTGKTLKDTLFARLEDSPAVFAISASVLGAIPAEVADVRDKQLTDLSSAAVTAVTMEQPAGTTHLLLDGSRWRMTKPCDALANAEMVDKLVIAVASLQAQTFEDPNSLAAASFAKPRCRLTLMLESPQDAGVTQLQAPPAPVTVLVGGQRSGGQWTYVRVGDDKSVAVVKTADVEPLLYEAANFYDPTILDVPYNKQVIGLTIARSAETFVLARTSGAAASSQPAQKWQVVKPAPAMAADDQQVEEVAFSLSHLRAAKVVAVGSELPQWLANAPGVDVTLEIGVVQAAEATTATGAATTTSNAATAPATPAVTETRSLRVLKLDDKAYAYVPGQKLLVVGEVEGRLHDLLAGELRNRKIVPDKPEDMQTLTISHGKTIFTLRREKDTWVCDSDNLAKIDSRKVDEYCKTLAQTTIERYLTDKEQAVAEIKDAGILLAVEWTASGLKRRLTVADLRRPDGNRQATLSDVTRGFLLSPETVGNLSRTLKDLEPSNEPPPEPEGPMGPMGPMPSMEE